MHQTDLTQDNNHNRMSIENMWSNTKGDSGSWGIEGYEVPRDYFDHLKTKQGKVLWEKLKSTKLENNWPPRLEKDSNDKLIWPKRPNYIDEIRKLATSCYKKERAEKILDRLKEKNPDFDKPHKPRVIVKELQGFTLHGDRKTNIDSIIHNEKKKYLQYPDKDDKINELREKIEKETKEKKSKIDEIKEKYKIKGSIPKCERITTVADSEYNGEKIPFCSVPKEKKEEAVADEDSKPKSKKFSYSTAFPSVLQKWEKSPIWTFSFSTKKEEEVLQRKKEIIDERQKTITEKYMEKFKKKNLNIELSQTYNNISNFRRIKIGLGKVKNFLFKFS